MTLVNSPNTTSDITLASYEFIYVLISIVLSYKWFALESHFSHYCLIISLEMHLNFLLMLVKKCYLPYQQKMDAVAIKP